MDFDTAHAISAPVWELPGGSLTPLPPHENHCPPNEYSSIRKPTAENYRALETRLPDRFSIRWLRAPGNRLRIDDVEYQFSTNQKAFLTMLNQVKALAFSKAYLIQFSKRVNFYSRPATAVGGKGLLFSDSSAVPVSTGPPSKLASLSC